MPLALAENRPLANKTNVTDAVRDMSPEECEIFDLILAGYNPANRDHLQEFVNRISSPLADVVLGLLGKSLIQKVDYLGKVRLMVNPAAAWILAPKDERMPRPD